MKGNRRTSRSPSKLSQIWKRLGIFVRFNLSLIVFCIGGVGSLLASVIVGLYRPIFYLNESQILYLFSTTSQVIAGLFGLTVAGYVFLRNELQREAKEDETLLDAVNAINVKFFRLVVFLSVVGAFSILYSLLSIASESGAIRSDNLTTVLNIAGSLSCLEVASIVYFAFEMLRPDRIEKTSTKIKQSFDTRGDQPGSLEEFIRDFNKIVGVLQEFYSRKPKINLLPTSRQGDVSNIKLINEMFYNEKINGSTRNSLVELVRFRNSLVHGNDLAISKDKNNWVKKLLNIVVDAAKT